jgi:hypothetical protein
LGDRASQAHRSISEGTNEIVQKSYEEKNRSKGGMTMEDTFKRIARHLYRRQYITENGDWSTLYYGIFVDWKGKRRCFPLGSDLRTAKEQLKVLEADNVKRKDFDLEKKEQQKAETVGMTVAEWLGRYLDLLKHKPSWSTKKAQCVHLKRLMGSLPLSGVTKVRIMEYKQRRLSESLIRHGKTVEDTEVKGSTVNREVSCLVAALNLAASEKLCDDAPRVEKERETPRDRTLTDDEYKALLDVSPRWLQRVIIGANEAALDRGVLVNLTWNSVKDGLIKVIGGREKTGADQRVGIVPALEEVLNELKAEFKRLPNTENRVFTNGGRPIPKATLRHAFERAVQDAKIEDFQLRDFRHCARTEWAAGGLPFEVAEVGLGHKIRGMAGRYTNLTDDQIREAFQIFVNKVLTQKKRVHERAN